MPLDDNNHHVNTPGHYEHAINCLSDLLPTQDELNAHYSPRLQQHDALQADEHRIYAMLKTGDNYNPYRRWLIHERAFAGSCASWAWGLERIPAVRADGPGVLPTGPCNPYSEVEIETLRRGIEASLERAKTGTIHPAATCWTMVIELADAYKNGHAITPKGLRRLADFQQGSGENIHFHQTKLQLLTIRDNAAYLIGDENYNPLKNNWTLPGALRSLHDSLKINVGLSKGDIYYLAHDRVVSDGFNRLWYGFKNLKPGTVVYDIERVGVENLTWVDLPDPRTLSYENHELSFIHGRIPPIC